MRSDLNLLEFIQQYSKKPTLFALGEEKFWDDFYISKSMLEAHLNPVHNEASRRPVIIDKTVRHLLESKLIKPGMKVLDLGCGPGLYAERLCWNGTDIVGIDISKRSIAYAKKHAMKSELQIEYKCMDFFDMDYTEEFDAVIQVYGELCTYSDEMRDKLLKLIYRALKKGGVFIFDVSTRKQRAREELKNDWYISEGGFWRPGKHLLLEQCFDYPEDDIWLDQYIVIDDQGVKVYRNWFHDYSFDSINQVLTNAGFNIKHVWNDLTGKSFTKNGDWIAIAASKVNLSMDKDFMTSY